MSNRRAMTSLLATMIAASAWMAATPARALLTLNCNWGIGPFVPVAYPLSTQVMMMPVVMDFGSPPFSVSQVAFTSFATSSQQTNDRGGVLRIVDGNCRTIASFPDPSVVPPPPIPPGCPLNLNSIPRLAPVSGVAAGNTDLSPDVEIVGVIDDPNTSHHRQIIAFNLIGGLVGGHLAPKWCSTPLPPGDYIPKHSAPAIAHLDKTGNPSQHMSQIVIDNKVFEGNGTLRYTGGVGPRSSTAVVANVVAGSGLPQVITGRGIYKSFPGLVWTGMPVSILSPAVSLGPYTFAAVAELDPTHPGPEIVVTDYLAHKVYVLKNSGGLPLASALVPGAGGGNAGGPPMIAVTGSGTVIGVAGVSRYTLFRYTPTPPSLHQIWSMPTNDPSGATTSTFYDTPSGPSIYYADAERLWVFSVTNGAVLDSVPATSGTLIEGPVIAAFDSGPAPGRVIVAASNYQTVPPFSPSAQHGLLIFWDSAIGPAPRFWNEVNFHRTNVTNSSGSIPFVELPSWSPTGHNTYRVQQWP